MTGLPSPISLKSNEVIGMKIINLEKIFGDRVLFEKASLSIKNGEKLALLGQNGTGKTTLFKCIAGEEPFDGEIILDSSVAVMEQEKVFEKVDLTFGDYLDEKKQHLDDMRSKIEEELGLPEVYENHKVYSRKLQEYELLCSRTTESREIEKQKDILYSLGYDLDILEKPISSLSGGQRTALRLTECLSKDADTLLLDEPTNHLDYASVMWLEEQLESSGKTVVIISHDRYFLDRFVSGVIEIENKQFVRYNTNYSNYLIDRVEHRGVLRKSRDSIESKRTSLMESSKEKRVWAHQNGNKSMKITADRLERDAQSLPVIPDPDALEKLYDFTCLSGLRTGTIVYDIKNINKSFDHPVLKNVSFSVNQNERIALVGDNGCGKSTLLKILAELLVTDSGSIQRGVRLNVGYFDQDGDNLPKRKKVVDYLHSVNNTFADYQIANFAKKMGLDHDLPKKIIGSLSGGEKARLQLIGLFNGKYNVLILDEPTNHLDLELREALEKTLNEFQGTIIFVSHDRFFIDKLATSIVHIKDGHATKLKGDYSDNF